MLEIFEIVGALLGTLSVILVIMFRKSGQKYVDEKAKNLATIEDTEKITKEVEKVKTDYLQRSHAWKYIFEYEYKVLKDVWSATWDLQAGALSLRPFTDTLPKDEGERKEVFIERYEKYSKKMEMFCDAVIKNQPFIPVKVYEICMSLYDSVREFQINFEMDIQHPGQADYKGMNACRKEVGKKIEDLNVSIREHIHGKLKGIKEES